MTDEDKRAKSASEIATETVRAEQQVELPKRFYESVEVSPAAGGFAVTLDNRPVKTPGKVELALPTKALANAVGDEWRGQRERIDPNTMPLTRLANTAIEAVDAVRDEVAADIAAYAGTDVVCYRADHPRELKALQEAAWNPVIDWAKTKLGASFEVTAGIVPIAQPQEALNSVADALAGRDAFALSALHVMTSRTGSALIALRCAYRDMSPDDAWKAAHVDEDWQISQWGEDAEAAASRACSERDFRAAARMLELLNVD